eukprot:4002971-Lingulodinium_polyedra.AAC.1
MSQPPPILHNLKQFLTVSSSVTASGIEQPQTANLRAYFLKLCCALPQTANQTIHSTAAASFARPRSSKKPQTVWQLLNRLKQPIEQPQAVLVQFQTAFLTGYFIVFAQPL